MASLADARGVYGRVQVAVFVADVVVEEFFVDVVHGFFFALPGLHWHPRAMPPFSAVALRDAGSGWCIVSFSVGLASMWSSSWA